MVKLSHAVPLTLTHTYICVCLHNVRFGAARPERAEADDEDDNEQYCRNGDYGHVAGVGQRGRVRGFSWNHVGQVQHVAQRPACITAFNLHTNHKRKNTLIQYLNTDLKAYVNARGH